MHSPEAIVTFSSADSALANCTAGLCFYEHSVRFLGAVSDSALLCLGYLYEGCYPACRPGTPAAASAMVVSVCLACLPQYQVPLPHSLALCCKWELSLPPLVLQVASCPTSDSVLALPVHPRVAADDFLLLGTMHLQCALRTGLLLYFLSVMHCLARALKLRKGSPCYNRTLRHARSSFRGASVWLALGAAACFVDGAASVRCPDMPPPAHPQLAESAVHSAPPPSARWAVGSDAPAWLDPTFRATSGARDLRVQAQVFRYQAPTVDAYEWVGPHVGVPYLCKLFHDEVFYPRDRCRVLPVHPQPQVGFVALIEAPFWLTDQLYAPVLFEIHAVVVVRFCDYLVGRVTVEDLRGRVGDHWIPGGRFFVADAAEPIQEDAVVHVPPGSLIRLLPQAAPLPPRVSLQVKLQDPQRWFVPAEYGHSPALQPGCIGLVGPLGEWTCIDASGSMEPRQLREAISDLCGASPSDVMATTPCEQPLSLSFRGARVVSLLSVTSRALAGGCIVFFDARDLGVPVSALCLPAVYTSVGSIIRLLGGSRPIGVPISVRGAADFDPGTETFLPVHRALVTVRVLSGDEAPLDAHAGPAPTSPLPAALPGASSASSSGWVAVNGDNASGACGRQPADDGMDRPSPPTPGIHAKHVWPAHLAALADRSCDVVHEAAGAPALGTTAGAGAFEANDFQDVGSPGEGSESGARDGSSASTLNTWRLPLRLLSFQRPDTFCTIFVAEGECLSDIMTRACILLDPPGDPHDLFVPDPQPVAEWLTVLVVPAWWKSRGSNAVLISSADADEHDHLAICSHGITIPDVLPPADSAATRRVDVYNTGGFVADAADIAPGSMLFLQSVGAPLPTLPSVRQIVSDTSLDCHDDQLPQPEVPPPLPPRPCAGA